MTEESAWGQLVSLTDFDSDPIPLSEDKISIGRALDNEVCLSENKLVSDHHCFIQRDKDGKVTLHDTSTNGTLLNLTHKISKGKSKQLAHGDEFYVVYKKINEENNVGYIYQDCEQLRIEEGTQEYSAPDLLDATLEDSDCNYISPEKSSEKKRKQEEDSSEAEKAAKKLKLGNDIGTSEKVGTSNDGKKENASHKATPSETEKGSKNQNKTCCDKKGDENIKADACDKDVNGEVEQKTETKGVTGDNKSKPVAPARDDIEENLQCMICQDIMHDCISLQPCLHTFCGGCYSDWMTRSQECPSCRKNVERINKNHIVNNLIEAYLKEHPEKRRPDEDIKELNEKNKITNDMLYPKEKLKRQESSDYSDTDSDDYHDPDDDNDDGDGQVAPVFTPAPVYVPPQAPALFGFGTPFFGMTRAHKIVCRQCPEYNNNTGVVGGIVNALNKVKDTVTGLAGGTAKTEQADAAGTSGENKNTDGKEETPGPSGQGSGTDNPGPSTSGETGDAPKKPKDDPKVMPDPPNYVCIANQNHVLCQCCLQPMPDKRNDPNFPPQQCSICYRAYCHAYWGCRKADCLGCIGKFKEMNFGRKSYVGIILDNQYESEIFRDFIDAKGMSVKDLLAECCNGLEAGHFSVADAKGMLVKDLLAECCNGLEAGHFSVAAQGTHNFNTNRPVCYACGVNIFKQAAFQYRKTIKKEEFPEAVRNRPDCYWGSKCRTQKNKPHHAKCAPAEICRQKGVCDQAFIYANEEANREQYGSESPTVHAQTDLDPCCSQMP